MKKISIAAVLAALCVSVLSARDIPNFGECLYELSSPTALTSGASVTGGALFSAGPESLIVNPALIAREQRVKLNLADTVLVSTDGETKLGDAFQAGIVIPFKMFILGTYLNGTFVDFDEMNLGNSLTLKAALSKEITDNLCVGIGISTAAAWVPDFDWALNANAGFVYTMGDVAFLKDVRYGVSVLNLGKCFGNEEVGMTGYPCLGTFKAGIAASVFKNDFANIGLSLDVSTPLFQNVIIDAGLKASYKDMIYFGVTEKIDIVEGKDSNPSYIPAVTVGFKFNFDFSKQRTEREEEKKIANYMEKHDWSESEFSVNAGWKQLYSSINAVSIGADLSLGMEDKTPPVIELWFGDEDEE